MAGDGGREEVTDTEAVTDSHAATEVVTSNEDDTEAVALTPPPFWTTMR